MRFPAGLVLPFLLLPVGTAASGDDDAHDWRKAAVVLPAAPVSAPSPVLNMK